jgi:hypothetical protein
MVTMRDDYSGTLTGVKAAATCDSVGGGYVPLHVGAAVERRDEAEEAKQFCTAGTAEFPGIVEPDSFGNPEHQTGSGTAACLTGIASAQARRWDWPRTRPEDTGAGSEKHRGTFGAEIPDQLVMGLQNA